ncbi:unnamed protein product, partial [Ixodes persulcatus]
YLAACLLRYNIFSFVYLLLLLASPLLCGPASTRSRQAFYYMKLVVAVSSFFCVCQVVYQAVLLSTKTYGKPALGSNTCRMPERLVSLIGLNRLDDLHVLEILRLLALDFAVLFASVATLLVSNTPVVDETTRPCPQSRWRVHSAVMGDFLVLLLMAGAAVLQASLSSLVYFAVFLGTATRLGMHLPLAEGYRLLRTCLMLYSAAHILVLYAYQLDYLQGLVPPSSLEARLIGLSPLRVAPCTGDESALADFRLLVFRRLHWTLYLSPLAVLGFYFVVATVTRYQLLQKTVN